MLDFFAQALREGTAAGQDVAAFAGGMITGTGPRKRGTPTEQRKIRAKWRSVWGLPSLFKLRHDEPGTGLGLLIVRKIVEGHGGFLRVESTVGRGLTFIFELPLAKS